MRRTHRRAYGRLLACMASVALLPVGTVARAQKRTAQSIVDGVVHAVCQKQIVLLGELPTLERRTPSTRSRKSRIG